jgi:plasmid stabilization system protein ParE
VTGRRPCRALIGAAAASELGAALDYLEKHSSSGKARDVLEQMDACIRRLRAFPESAPIDPGAPRLLVQPEAKGRSTHAADFSIRYAFPVRFEEDEKVVLILSIRHGRRRPVGDPEYVRRFIAEVAAGRRAKPP